MRHETTPDFTVVYGRSQPGKSRLWQTLNGIVKLIFVTFMTNARVSSLTSDDFTTFPIDHTQCTSAPPPNSLKCCSRVVLVGQLSRLAWDIWQMTDLQITSSKRLECQHGQTLVKSLRKYVRLESDVAKKEFGKKLILSIIRELLSRSAHSNNQYESRIFATIFMSIYFLSIFIRFRINIKIHPKMPVLFKNR